MAAHPTEATTWQRREEPLPPSLPRAAWPKTERPDPCSARKDFAAMIRDRTELPARLRTGCAEQKTAAPEWADSA